MMAYLQHLKTAMLGRNEVETRRLLKHPLATLLPVAVREEALTMTRGHLPADWTPARFLHFYAVTEPLMVHELPSPSSAQLELPLGPTPGAWELTVARAGLLAGHRG